MKDNGHDSNSVRFIDLFCGIGGFRIAIELAAEELETVADCVFSCDIDEHCQKTYEANFGERPVGDIALVNGQSIPDHNILLAGFPCQPFSIIGNRRGFDDTRGTLFFEIARILEAKKPTAFLLENVKLLVGHNNGKTLARIMAGLRDLGYYADYRVLNALHFGLPQKRERVFIVGFREPCSFEWPKGGVPMTPLKEILEDDVPDFYYASEYIRENRLRKHDPTEEPTIWHENKGGHISAYPFSCALRAGASYNYLLVNGERRLTLREMLRLQGFPDSFNIVCNYSQTRKQAGNSLPVPVASAVLRSMLLAQGLSNGNGRPLLLQHHAVDRQMMLFEKRARYETKSKTKNRRKIPAPICPQ